MASSTKPVPKKYQKRLGTSGIRGQLYETKLLSLIYFRAIHDVNIEEIYLATNVDKVGSFDDICLRAKLKGIEKPMIVFLQAKHRENSNTVLTLNKSDLVEYFNSYLEIRSKFKPNNDDVLFNGEFDKTECVFVIYTTAKGEKESKKYEGSLADYLNALIGTGDPGSQPSHDEGQVESLCKIVLEEQMTALARQMMKCIFGELSDNQMLMLMKNELLIRYHVILAQKVFDVSDIQPEGHRNASFREDFFDINGDFLQLFKDELCTEILKKRNRGNTTQSSRLSDVPIFLQADLEIIYETVASALIFQNGKFVFCDENIPNYFLNKINESQENIRRTVELAIKECFNLLGQDQSIAGHKPDRLTCFSTLKFKVPASFGNKDLSIKGSDVKVERKLDDLTSKIIEFIDKAKPNNIVTIDHSLGEGFLQLSGGIASAVGNLLVSDESSKLLKFNGHPQGTLAKKLYCKLREKYDLAEYKFDVKAKVFPKLSISTDEYTRKIVSDFLSTLIFYTSQYDEKNVEKTLICEININQSDEIKHVEIASDAIFLKFHDAIQKWSMTSEAGKGTYLEKEGGLYENAKILSTSQPLLRVINMMLRIKNKDYDFSEEAVYSIKLDELVSGTIIVTDNREFTIAKLTKQLNNKDSAVLDFEYIINLSPRDDKALRAELMNSKEVNTLIVVFDKALIAKSSKNKLLNIASSMKNKRVIIITDQNSVEDAKEIFSPTGKVIKDEKNRLIDMTEETRNSILENTKVIFQGDEITLGEILSKNWITDITGDVLYNIMNGNQNYIGKQIINSNYKPQSYIQRSVRQYFRRRTKGLPGVVKGGRICLKSLNPKPTLLPFYRVSEYNDVLIIGDPGMGKSTLLTHLTFNAKKYKEIGTSWIVRANLLEHTTQFSKWKYNKTDIDALQCFRFLCQAALSKESSDKLDLINITLEKSNIILIDFKGDERTLFELKFFLNFYNSSETLFILFDGFDEICPNYANEVLKLIKAVKEFRRNHKMWITSRSNNRMNTILELKFKSLFEIEPLEGREQHLYLTTLWDEQKILKDLNEDHLKNIDEFIRFMSRNMHDKIRVLMKKSEISPSKTLNQQFSLVHLGKEIPLIIVYLSFIKYLKTNFSFAPSSVMTALNKLYDECYELDLFKNKFLANPLHLNILVDYFYNKIKESNLTPNTWNEVYENLDVYKHFLEIKLKKIRYQDKTQNDMTKPDNILAYERDYADFMNKHKKLAAYAVYGKSLFDNDDLEQLMKMIHELTEGEERTGIICNVLDDIPIFVHSTLKEYFAVEFICDLLKSKDNQGFLWDYILNEMFLNCNKNILATFDDKMKVDEKLTIALKRNHKLIFDLLLKQSKNTVNENGEIRSTLCEAIRHDLQNFVRILFNSVIEDNVDESNLEDFIKIVKKTNMLIVAVKMDLIDPISTIIRLVKKVDKTKLSSLFQNIKPNITDIDNASVDDLIQMLNTHVWDRMGMGIVRDWEDILKLSGQVYFIPVNEEIKINVDNSV